MSELLACVVLGQHRLTRRKLPRSRDDEDVISRTIISLAMAVDSKLPGCDLVRLKVAEVFSGGEIKERVSILHSKTKTAVCFEITEGTRKSLMDWIGHPLMSGHDFLWPGRFHDRLHISTRQ